MAKAFLETYGLNINDVFNHRFSLAVESFRWVVANIFPVITRAAWASKKSDIIKKDSTATEKNFRYKMRQREYDKQFGTGYKHPGFFPTIVSFFIRVLPKVGPLRSLKFKTPSALSEKYFVQSFDSITLHYNDALNRSKQNNVLLKDFDFDTGKPTAICEYSLADNTYDSWLIQLKKDGFKSITAQEKQNIEGFYHWHDASKNINFTRKCKEIFTAYQELQNATPAQ